MKRMIDGVVAFVPSYCNTVISFYMFIVLAASTHSFQRRFHVTMEQWMGGASLLVVILQHTYSKTTQWQSQINDKDIPRSTYCYLVGFLGYIFSLYSIYSDVCMCASVCMYRYVARMKENLVSPHSSMRFTTLALLHSVCVTVTYPYDIRPYVTSVMPQQRRNGKTIRS